MIVCFGEVLVDCLPTVEVVGGAPFNVAIHLKRLKNEVDFVSAIGDDEKGQRIQRLLENEGLAEQVTKDKIHPTGYVTVWFEEKEPKYTIHAPCSWQYLETADHITVPEMMVFGSLGTCFSQNKRVIQEYREMFSETTFLCDLNLRAPMYSKEHVIFCLGLTDILKVNEDEFEYLKTEVFHVKSDQKVLQELSIQFNISKIMLTKAEKGVDIIWDDKCISAPAPLVPQDAFEDAIGAGDSFTAVFIDLFLKYPDRLESNIDQALVFASRVCANKGAIPEGMDLYHTVGY